MQPACIRHTDLPGTSRLFADFSYHFDRVSGFYRYAPLDAESLTKAAAAIQYPDDRRAAMVKALGVQNGDSASLRKLAEPGTLAVVTGQQVGLFSGPAYTIYKAISAAKLAARLTEQGTPAVPVFWLATEDHDFAEVNHSWVFGPANEPIALSVKAADTSRPRPVGGIEVVNPPIAQLRAILGDFPFMDEVVAAVEAAYPAGVTMGQGFRALLKTILAKLDLLYLDPLDPAIREIAAPFLAKAMQQAPDLKAKLMARNRELTSAGYHAQVHVDDKMSLFFLLENGERQPMRRKDSDFSADLDRAANVSPNALLRPVMQDYLLPTVAYIGGPGELAYFAQSEVLYDQLLGRMPVMMTRSGFTILDPRSAKLLDRFHLTVAQTFVTQEALHTKIAQELVPAELEQSIATTAADVNRKVAALKTQLEAFDPTLAAALGKSSAKIAYQMEKIRRKTEREALRRDQRAQSDAQHIAARLYPHRHLQERFYSILPFLAQHGFDLVDRLYDAVQPDCVDHRVYTV
jgi:bacillithiol biosynthesis cysteine-adding enzyme BshC